MLIRRTILLLPLLLGPTAPGGCCCDDSCRDTYVPPDYEQYCGPLLEPRDDAGISALSSAERSSALQRIPQVLDLVLVTPELEAADCVRTNAVVCDRSHLNCTFALPQPSGPEPYPLVFAVVNPSEVGIAIYGAALEGDCSNIEAVSPELIDALSQNPEGFEVQSKSRKLLELAVGPTEDACTSEFSLAADISNAEGGLLSVSLEMIADEVSQ